MPRQTPCRARLWPSLWVPLALLLTGLATTAAVARLESAQARALAEARYQAQHLALVNRLLTLAPEHVGDDSPPSSWLPILFGDALPDDLGLRIDTLQRHTKTPLLELQTRHLDDPTRALRTEVQPGPYHWMLTTVPTEALLEGASRRVGARVWLAGLTLSLLASGLALLLCRRLARQAARIQALIASETRASRGISNLETEQSILRQALDDSETRSRDLVQLSGGLTSELDERGRIDFMSEQCADWLGPGAVGSRRHPVRGVGLGRGPRQLSANPVRGGGHDPAPTTGPAPARCPGGRPRRHSTGEGDQRPGARPDRFPGHRDTGGIPGHLVQGFVGAVAQRRRTGLLAAARTRPIRSSPPYRAPG